MQIQQKNDYIYIKICVSPWVCPHLQLPYFSTDFRFKHTYGLLVPWGSEKKLLELELKINKKKNTKIKYFLAYVIPNICLSEHNVCSSTQICPNAIYSLVFNQNEMANISMDSLCPPKGFKINLVYMKSKIETFFAYQFFIPQQKCHSEHLSVRTQCLFVHPNLSQCYLLPCFQSE